MPIVAAYAERIPQLDADEALHWSTVLNVGTAKLKPASMRRILQRWQRIARGKRRAQKATSLEDIRAYGIAVVEEKADG